MEVAPVNLTLCEEVAMQNLLFLRMSEPIEIPEENWTIGIHEGRAFHTIHCRRVKTLLIRKHGHVVYLAVLTLVREGLY